MTAKWTEGEVREALEREDDDVIREILSYVISRGDRVIDRGNMSLGMYAEEDDRAAAIATLREDVRAALSGRRLYGHDAPWIREDIARAIIDAAGREDIEPEEIL